MGIQGLLKNLHPLLVPPPDHPSHAQQNGPGHNRQRPPPQRNNPSVKHNIQQFAGKSLAVDASSWLHKAAYTCAERLVEATESGTRDARAEQSYTRYMVDRCDELLKYAKVDKVYLVFDGIRVPLKSGTNAEREAKRQANIREARRLMSLGRRHEAGEKYRSCVKGNDEMARVVAGAVERKWGKDATGTNGNVRVKCIWSPYEADAQLAKLCIDGWAHAVVTEDSDVLVYSAVTRKPFPIIYKLDRKNGSCDVVTMDWLVNPRFLAAMNGSSGGSGSSRRRRRRERDRDLDYIYNDRPLDDEDAQSEPSEGSGGSGEEATADAAARHPCEVEYDDLVFAPIRRALPIPSTSNGGGRANRRGSSGSEGNAAGTAVLTYLRAFATQEKKNPGAGVRLFVQACVLSGCDYVPNRLSKVGPVTAFRLVKDVVHRSAADRFERVLKSLPAGSKLVAEVPANSSEDGADDGMDEEEDDDFMEPPDNDRDAKEKYEELLSKSEAVFYYHLAKELGTGNIVPLVAHRKSSEGGDEERLDAEASHRPCIDRFEQGLEFVGSAEEALKQKPVPLQPITGQSQSYRRPALHQQNNNSGGWMSTNRRNGSSSALQKHNSRTQQLKPLAAEPPKETPMQKWMKEGNQNANTSMKKVLGNKKSLNAGASKSAGSLIKSKEIARQSESKRDSPCKQSSSSANDAPARAKSNPFSAFALPAGSEKAKEPKMKPSVLAKSSGDNKASKTSPFFSPMKFDYGSNTTPTGSEKKPKPTSCVDDTNVASKAPEEVKDDPVEMLDDEDNDEPQQQLPKSSAEVNVDNTTEEDGFDYTSGIVEESPPIISKQPRGFLSDYIHQTNPSDDKLGPRRVSTSPQKNEHDPEEVIELDSDTDEDVAPINVAPVKRLIVDENCPNLSQSSTARSSVNKRPFKSPYPTASSTASGGSKRARPMSSSALLAGFARQEKSSSASRSKIGTKKTSKFFPPSKGPSKSGTRPKGVPSLKNYMVPSELLEK